MKYSMIVFSMLVTGSAAHATSAKACHDSTNTSGCPAGFVCKDGSCINMSGYSAQPDLGSAALVQDAGSGKIGAAKAAVKIPMRLGN